MLLTLLRCSFYFLFIYQPLVFSGTAIVRDDWLYVWNKAEKETQCSMGWRNGVTQNQTLACFRWVTFPFWQLICTFGRRQREQHRARWDMGVMELWERRISHWPFGHWWFCPPWGLAAAGWSHLQHRLPLVMHQRRLALWRRKWVRQSTDTIWCGQSIMATNVKSDV